MEPREFQWPMSVLYSRFFARAMEPAYAEVARQAPIPPQAQALLDIGGADGRLALALAKQYPHLPRIVTADISQDLVTRAQRKAREHGFSERIHSEVQDVHNLNYPDDSFDVTMSFGSMHHWRDPVTGVKELCRVLKPQGKLLIYDGNDRPSLKDMKRTVSTIEGSTIWTALVYWMGSKDFLSRDEITGIVRDAGIKFLSITWNGPLCLIGGTKEG
ncbi:MAG: class I SAM-dependent methyltransferase [bacterium]